MSSTLVATVFFKSKRQSFVSSWLSCTCEDETKRLHLRCTSDTMVAVLSILSNQRKVVGVCVASVLALTLRTFRPSFLRGFLLLTGDDPIISPSKKQQLALNITNAMKYPHQVIQRHCAIDYEMIARKRRLQHPQASQLLRRIVQHPMPNFDHATDMFVFEHILKTGGTTFSKQLVDLFGSQHVLPGSRPSGFFNKDELIQATQKLSDSQQVATWWDSQRVAFSHSYFQHISHSDFEGWFLNQIPNNTVTGEPRKRLYLGTIYRDPIEWIASNFFEWMCRLGGRMQDAWQGLHPEQKKGGLSPKASPKCKGMNNLTLLADYWFHHTLPRKCNDGTMDKTQMCSQYEKTGQDPMLHCRSMADFTASDNFRKQMRDNPPYLITSQNESLADLEQRAMERYGGLVPHRRVPVAWIGLTERYEESLLLFYDWMGWPLDTKFQNTPTMRYKPCRPTSFWSDEEQRQLSRLVKRSWVVHNMANAILDVRVAEWCCRRREDEDASKRSVSKIEAAVVEQYCHASSDGEAQ